MEMEQFKQSLLKYLFVEKTFEDEDAEKQKMMSDEEKIENDLLLVGATVVSQDENIYELNVPDNYSKLRVGDKVILNDIHLASSFDATITDIFFDTITVMCDKQLDISSSFTIEQKSPQLINILIYLLSKPFLFSFLNLFTKSFGNGLGLVLYPYIIIPNLIPFANGIFL